MQVFKVETVKNVKALEKALNAFAKNGWTVNSIVCDSLSGAKSHFGNRGKERYTIIASMLVSN